MSIRKIFVYFLFIQVTCSCKHRFFRTSSNSMGNTIKAGQHFYVEPAGKFERNDIVVFNYFGNDYNSPTEEFGKYNQHWEKRIFRLIAYSGDVVEIKDGEIFINDHRIPPPPSALFNYEIKSGVYIDDLADKDPDIGAIEQRGDTIVYIVALIEKEAQGYAQRKPAIFSVKRSFSDFPANDTSFARGAATGNWSMDNYGPLIIPSPGDTISVNSFNYKIYKNIPGVQQGKSLLKEKLYFLLGDNRYGAEDCRFTGLIPHSKMYGIVK